MTNSPNEAVPLAHIQQLVAEEHAPQEKPALEQKDRERLSQMEVELDQCWDLLRQRRALREVGHDPAEAELRPPNVVEKYIG